MKLGRYRGLILGGAAVAVMLLVMHRTGAPLWWGFILLCPLMHLFMHGSHGSHGRDSHGSHGRDSHGCCGGGAGAGRSRTSASRDA